MPTNDQQRRAIAYLAKTHRDAIPRAPKLDEAGLMACLAKVHHIDAATVAMAAMRLAADPSIKTPGMIADPTSSVYRERLGPELARRHPTPDAACRTCGNDVDTCATRGCDNPTTRPTPRDPAAYTTHAQRARDLLRADTERGSE